MRQEPYDRGDEILSRRTTLVRSVLFLIILGTLPLYLVGFVLWATAPADDNNGGATATPDVIASFTPIGSGATATPTRPSPTPFPTLPGAFATARPFATSIRPANTPIIIPPATAAPTLTFAPTNTQAPPATATFILLPPTDTPFPAPTNTQAPPAATNTIAPVPTTESGLQPTPTDADGGAGPAP